MTVENESLTLTTVADYPENFTYQIQFSSGKFGVLRPLTPIDEPLLFDFLFNLSPTTRQFLSINGNVDLIAQEMCNAIGKYDKLRFVISLGKKPQLIGLISISFDIPSRDQTRFKGYDILLHNETDCRLAPCISDQYQNMGLGTTVLSHLINIVRMFGQSRIILLGGVHANNPRAIRYYEKNNFKRVGQTNDGNAIDVIDMMLEI